MHKPLVIVQMRARPSNCGVTDHSLALANGLRQCGVPTRLLTSGASIDNFVHFDWDGPPVIHDDENVLVQLSAYGFDVRGLPTQLETWIRALRDSSWRGKLVVFFHETWASTWRPWKSAFWYSPFQRASCARLAGLADISVFNSVVMLRWGENNPERQACYFTPVFSNVGEPLPAPEWNQRAPSCVVFGSSEARAHVYRNMRGRLHQLLGDWGFSEIVDIGRPLPADAQEILGGLPVRYLGALPAEAVSRQLVLGQAGLFATPWGFASKSGVFAAYQAHGLIPISVSETGDAGYQGAPGPTIGKDFLSVGRSLPVEQRAAFSDAIYNQYQDHSITKFSKQLADSLSNGAPRV